MAFQLFVSRIATIVAINVLYATTCPLSKTRANGQTAITVIQGISTGIALWACLILERRLHTKMQEHQALFKLFSVKAVVILDSIQVIIFPTIAEHRVFKPSPPWPVSWNDFAFALPNFLLVMEMAIVSITLLWAFDVSRYRDQRRAEVGIHRAGPFTALMDSLFLRDMGQGVLYAYFGRIPSSWYESSDGTELARVDQPHHGQEVEFEDLNKKV